MNQLWLHIAASAGIALDESQHNKLADYLLLLLSANRRMNLTRIDDPTQAELLHVGDALTLLPFLPCRPHRLADVGSGGGLPGIPIAIVRPDIRVTLIEATMKKADFLQEAAGKLQLGNVAILPRRSEQLRGHQWDVVTARALAPMDKLVTLCLPLVKPGGKLLAMKGPRGRDELSPALPAIRRYRGQQPVIHPANLPGRDHIIIEIARRE